MARDNHPEWRASLKAIGLFQVAAQWQKHWST
jgi:hypothetical protein